MKTLGLYIHIPFCKAKCGYCDFNSYAGKEEYIESYFSAVLKELEQVSANYPFPVDTVYFGGGTPTFVGTKYICNTLLKVKELFEQCSNNEISIECNPGTIGYEGLKALKNAGFNRLSIGLQSADNQCLKVLGRIHTFEDFGECFQSARKAGFDNISLDLMYGLPEQNIDNWNRTLKKAVEFDAEHISCYSLKVEEGTPFSRMNLTLPDDDTVADMYELAIEILGENGYDRYEISNFAKQGYRSRHNLKYWMCEDFVGVGAGAFSCVGRVRFSNVSALEEYIRGIENGIDVRETEGALSNFDKMSEFVFLGLRLKDGVSEDDFKRRFNLNIDEIFGSQIKKYTEMGFLVRKNRRIRFSDKGFFVSNTILSDFV